MPLLNSLRKKLHQNQSSTSNTGLSDLFKSRNQPPQHKKPQPQLILPNRQTTPAHNLLFLPEFLYPVFSHLDQKSIFSVRLVCLQWSSIARQYLTLTTQWRDDLSKNQKAEMAARLAFVDTLEVIDADDAWIKIAALTHEASTLIEGGSSSKVSTSEDPLLLALQGLMVMGDTNRYREEREFASKVGGSTLANHRQSQLQKLILTKAQKFEKRLESMLGVLPMLTCLEFMDTINTKVDMYRILELCPNLRRFVLEYAWSGEIAWTPTAPNNSQQTTSTTVSTFDTSPCPVFTHNLDTLILRHATMDEVSLESLCTALPNLLSLEVRFLRLIEVGGDRIFFSRQGFYRSLARSCPRIESLHFSLYHCSLTVEDSVVLQHSFPVLKELSMAGKDLDDPVFGYRIKLMEYYANYLTKLEILCYTTNQGSRFLERLHQFLCSARHLRHLIAPRLQYLTEYLDLEEAYDPSDNSGGQEDETTYYRPRNAAARQGLEWKIPARRWACQDLETLHLGFTAHFGSSTAAEHSRIMFGYISRYCPRLKDLRITKQTLNLHIDGGLCLLTRLRHLEKLKISSHTIYFKLKVSDIDWIGQRVSVKVEADPSASTPTTAVGAKKKSIDYFKSLVTRRKDKSVFAIPVPASKTIEGVFEMDREWSKSRRRSQASSVNSDLTDRHDNWRFSEGSESGYVHWPHLRSFVLEVDPTYLFKDVAGIALIQKLRPDINFKVQ
ncbi:hypothetical protein BGX26_009946 [Mortierella sp. AD094]|nr:hypothetical protein BGX26_009946 [Mortierella sp. AD094]